MNIAEKLEKMRDSYGIKKAVVARALGISSQAYYKKINGGDRFNHEQLEAFAELLGYELELIKKFEI